MNRNKIEYWRKACAKWIRKHCRGAYFEATELEWGIEIAIHYFSQHYHSGQWSDLYSVSCQSEYKPGPMVTFKRDMRDDRLAYTLYRKLARWERKRNRAV